MENKLTCYIQSYPLTGRSNTQNRRVEIPEYTSQTSINRQPNALHQPKTYKYQARITSSAKCKQHIIIIIIIIVISSLPFLPPDLIIFHLDSEAKNVIAKHPHLRLRDSRQRLRLLAATSLQTRTDNHCRARARTPSDRIQRRHPQLGRRHHQTHGRRASHPRCQH